MTPPDAPLFDTADLTARFEAALTAQLAATVPSAPPSGEDILANIQRTMAALEAAPYRVPTSVKLTRSQIDALVLLCKAPATPPGVIGHLLSVPIIEIADPDERGWVRRLLARAGRVLRFRRSHPYQSVTKGGRR